MLREIFFPLMDLFSGLNIFRYITFRASYAAVTALLISLFLGPWLIRLLAKHRVWQSIRSDGPTTHYQKKNTPTMGGLLIIASLVISSLLWMDVRNSYAWVAVLSTVGFGLVGFVDDWVKYRTKASAGIHARVKLIGQAIVSLMVVIVILLQHDFDQTTRLYFPFLKNITLSMGYAYIPFAMLILISTTNAVNITDGLDGLAVGLVIIVSLAFAVFAYLTGRIDFATYLGIPYFEGVGELTIIALALSGASVGFLWFNSYPAKIMMGDTGSMALGGLIGVLAILTKKEILLPICGGVFVIETLSIIIQVISYKIRKQRVFLMSPIHHHFELKGWSETQVVQRLWILGGIFAILGLSSLKIQ